MIVKIKAIVFNVLALILLTTTIISCDKDEPMAEESFSIIGDWHLYRGTDDLGVIRFNFDCTGVVFPEDGINSIDVQFDYELVMFDNNNEGRLKLVSVTTADKYPAVDKWNPAFHPGDYIVKKSGTTLLIMDMDGNIIWHLTKKVYVTV